MKYGKIALLALAMVSLLVLSACSFGKKPSDTDDISQPETAEDIDISTAPTETADLENNNEDDPSTDPSEVVELPLDPFIDSDNSSAEGDASGGEDGSVTIGEDGSIQLPPIPIEDLQP